MNAQVLNPFAQDIPERIESTFENAYANCIAYSSKSSLFPGSYLAVGRTDGFVTIYDIETRNVLRWIGGHVKSVTSLCWSPHNRYLATSSLDWTVHIIELPEGKIVRSLQFDAPVTQVNFAPDRSNRIAVLLDTRELVLISIKHKKLHNLTIQIPEGASSFTFTPDGKQLAIGSPRGNLYISDLEAAHNLNEPISIASSSVRQIVFDASGRHMVVNCNDRTLRTFELLPTVDQHIPFHFQARHKFQDLVGRTPWSGIAFSGDGEYIMGGAAHDAGHNIYIWSRDAGALTKILEGPREPLIFAVWHPIQPQIISIAASGDLFLWRTKWTEIWSAYAPGFEELDENVVYEEREDEFDLEDEHELTRKKQNEEEGMVNVFSNGPSHSLLVLHTLRSSTFQEASQWSPFTSSIPNDIQSSTSSLNGSQDNIKGDEYDDDNEVALIITPILAEAQPEVNGSL